MSAPRTMSEQAEKLCRDQASMSWNGPVSIHLGSLLKGVLAELDAERAAFTALEQEYAQAVRALREAKPCVCGWKFIKASDQRRFDKASNTINAVLSTPRAQAVKEVE